jgi:phosphate transport system substrate-binding protein
MSRGWRAWPLAVVALLLGLLGSGTTPVQATPARINGSGSTYVALAMQQWVADGQTDGLQLAYTATGSPDGLSAYANNVIDFAGTEAEYSALSGGSGSSQGDGRGYQYVPDVAGAIAVMYNVDDKAGRKVDYLHLSRRTIARIFTGDITNWSDPAITADNKGLELPDRPITVVYRSGQSGTTALFYDFIASVAPDIFTPWARRYQFPTDVRIIQLDSAPNFAPKTLALTGSDQIAQTIASNGGKWAIAYDEFGYAKTYKAPTAWVYNKAGNAVLPYAQNISAALESATLRPDLSQELSGVYDSPNTEAYPLSAYSYMVTQCAPSGERPTCKAAYPNSGISETLTKWMRYIACDGQVNMARIGYSPLPPNLSQEVANSIARLTGTSAETLNAGNCNNPRFRGSLGAGASSPADPYDKVTSLGGGSSAAASGSSGATASGATGSTAATASGGRTTTITSIDPVTGEVVTKEVPLDASGDPLTESVGGGSASWRLAAPVEYNRPAGSGLPAVVLVLFLLVVVTPPVAMVGIRRARGELSS